MKICYIVYREDNVMVFDSQVLQYLKAMKAHPEIDEIELIVFRHEENINKKDEVESKIKQFVNSTKTFISFPILSKAQLDVNAARLKKYIKNRYSISEQVAVICRGELATYIGAKAFRDHPNSRILFDNRGLPLEESEMRYKDKKIHVINRKKKRIALNYAKSHCDMYNFVTNAMREYVVQTYRYNAQLPFTIIPTLYHPESVDAAGWDKVVQIEKYEPSQMVISYIGSTASWQSTSQLIDIITKIATKYKNSRFMILTKGTIPEIENLPPDIRDRLTVKGVPHSQVKYYLKMSDFGLVIRDDNIVNQVAAPTKIAEYLTAGVSMLYAGNIGILKDIDTVSSAKRMIAIDQNDDWIEKLETIKSAEDKTVDPAIINYFSMEVRQRDTIGMIVSSFKASKVK